MGKQGLENCVDGSRRPTGALSSTSRSKSRPDHGVYYVCFQDFGRRGREAIVDPELTRSNIIDKIARKDFGFEHVVAVHAVHIATFTSEDITEEVLNAASLVSEAA